MVSYCMYGTQKRFSTKALSVTEMLVGREGGREGGGFDEGVH